MAIGEKVLIRNPRRSSVDSTTVVPPGPSAMKRYRHSATGRPKKRTSHATSLPGSAVTMVHVVDRRREVVDVVAVQDHLGSERFERRVPHARPVDAGVHRHLRAAREREEVRREPRALRRVSACADFSCCLLLVVGFLLPAGKRSVKAAAQSRLQRAGPPASRCRRIA